MKQTHQGIAARIPQVGTKDLKEFLNGFKNRKIKTTKKDREVFARGVRPTGGPTLSFRDAYTNAELRRELASLGLRSHA